MSQAEEMENAEAWQTLVHVCQKWRWVVFGSPRRLNLQLVCGPATPVREMLDIWPPLPIVIQNYDDKPWPFWGMDNVIAALEHNDRISVINVIVDSILSSFQFKNVLEAMQKPFPALTELRLESEDETAPVDPDLFLGGSAPGLRVLRLGRIPFQGLPKLLLSAPHLTQLLLSNIPLSGYISPEAMITGISALTKLETLSLYFDSPQSFPFPDLTSRSPPPPTRTLLPALIHLLFQGENEYLELFVSGIDAPLLEGFSVTVFPQLSFDTPQFTEFVSRTPRLKSHDEATISFSDLAVLVAVPQLFSAGLTWQTLCMDSDSDWRLSSMVHICTSSISQVINPLVKYLFILDYQETWDDNIENDQWLDLLRPFNGVQELYLSQEITNCIAPALQELFGERATEVLPGLQHLFLELPGSQLVQDVVGRFVAARQLSGHPIAVSQWL